MLMNVFLFVPVGLTLPYAVEMAAVLIEKRRNEKKNETRVSDSYKHIGGLDRRKSRYADINNEQSSQSRMNILYRLATMDGSRITGRLKIIGCSILLAAAFSFCIEFLQVLFALGTAEVDDVIMNSLGATIGCLSFLVRLGGIKYT